MGTAAKPALRTVEGAVRRASWAVRPQEKPHR